MQESKSLMPFLGAGTPNQHEEFKSELEAGSLVIYTLCRLHLWKNSESKAQRPTLVVNYGNRCSGRKPHNDLGEQAVSSG